MPTAADAANVLIRKKKTKEQLRNEEMGMPSPIDIDPEERNAEMGMPSPMDIKPKRKPRIGER